jgi:hypothetical protein
MNQQRDLDALIATWLDDGPIDLPDETRRAIAVGLRTQPRARRVAILGGSAMFALNRIATAAAIVLVVGALSVFVLSNRAGGPGTTPQPSMSVAPSAAPSSSPGASASRSASSVALFADGSLISFVSTRYGFSLAHPADWTEVRSDHEWALPADADWRTRAAEEFKAPGESILVTAWSVSVASGTTIDSWLKTYCPLATTPCSGLAPLTKPVTMDGHAGSLIQFKDDTQAFVLVGDRMYVVAVWEPDTDPRTAPYGGAQQLLMDYLATISLTPGGPASASSSPTPS